MDIVDIEADFKEAERCVGKRSFVGRGFVREWPATKHWTPAAFFDRYGESTIVPKRGSPADGVNVPMKIAAFFQASRGRTFEAFPFYLHDVALSAVAPELCREVGEAPIDMMPAWYKTSFHTFLRLFWGPAGAVTPFHFDTLGTHNCFFQIFGRKRVVIVDASHRDSCYLKDWRWSEIIDPRTVDGNRFPAFARVSFREVELSAGDMLYMPPYTMHFFESREESISLNIDWHSKASAWRALFAHTRGMPSENFSINCRLAAGVWLNVPVRWLFRSLALA